MATRAIQSSKWAYVSSVRDKATRLVRAYANARPNALFGGTGYTCTVALSAAGAATTISSPVAVALNAFTNGFRTTYDRNGGFMRSPSNGAYFLGRRNSISSIYPNTHGQGVGIWTMAPQIEVAMLDFNNGSLPSSLIARVNGEFVNSGNPSALPGLGSTNVHRYLLSFLDNFGAAHVAPRFVVFFAPTQGNITGINISQNHVAMVGPQADPADTRIGIISNSYGFGQGPTNPRKTPGHQIGEAFGWKCDTIISAVGGIGYAGTQAVGPSGSAVKFIDLIPGLAQFGRDYFDAIVVLGGLTNDGSQTTGNITTAATAFFTELKVAFPGTPKIVTGPFQWSASIISSDRLAAELAVFNAVLGADSSARYVDTVGGSPSGSWQNTATSSNYAGDGIHPSDAGGVDIGINHAGPDIYAALLSIAA